MSQGPPPHSPPRPIPPAQPAQPVQPLQVPPLQYGGYAVPGYGPRPKGMAVASLVLGICSLCICVIPYVGWCSGFICAILAVIFGAIARRAAIRGEADGQGMATAGLICGLICISLFVIVILLGVLGVGYGALFAQGRPANPGF